MPVVTIREAEYTPATFNTEAITDSTLALFQQHFGPQRVDQDAGGDGRRGLSRYWLADKRSRA